MKLYWDGNVFQSEKYFVAIYKMKILISDLNVHITIYNNDFFKQFIIVTSGE